MSRRALGCCSILVLLVVVVGVIGILRAIQAVDPKQPQITVTDAFLNRFDFSPADNILDYNLILNFTYTNPNKNATAIEYRSIQVIGYYNKKKFSSATLIPSETNVQPGGAISDSTGVQLQGRQQGIGFSRCDVSKLKKETASGVYNYSIGVEFRLRVKYKGLSFLQKLGNSAHDDAFICYKLRIPLTPSGFNAKSKAGFTAKPCGDVLDPSSEHC